MHEKLMAHPYSTQVFPLPALDAHEVERVLAEVRGRWQPQHQNIARFFDCVSCFPLPRSTTFVLVDWCFSFVEQIRKQSGTTREL